MKQNQPLEVQSSSRLANLANALVECAKEFHADDAPPLIERVTQLAFANGFYLTVKNPEDAEKLLAELDILEITGGVDRSALVATLHVLLIGEAWLRAIGEKLSTFVQDRPDDLGRILFGFFAGLHVAKSLPNYAKLMGGQWDSFNNETKFLYARLIKWRLTDWKPEQLPFVEFMAGFYTSGSMVGRVMVGSSKVVLAVAHSFSNCWQLRVWAETGWEGGRQAVLHQPEHINAMIAELREGLLQELVELYRSCVLTTTAPDGSVRPERVALRFFSLRRGRDYAEIYCRGDQPRLIAHAAFDFCFWMGVLSTQPIPRAATRP